MILLLCLGVECIVESIHCGDDSSNTCCVAGKEEHCLLILLEKDHISID